jgi:hypothetical protein
MSRYIEEALTQFPVAITKPSLTPANRHLFMVDPDSAPLSENKLETFHSIVAKLLYVTKRGRPDIQLAVAYLCTRVSCATLQDWDKLHRLLKYLYGTKEESLILGADVLSSMHTWVDAAYGVHMDMKSHTGGVISFGTGAVITKSAKQKLNTKSSTEAELVGASDCLPSTIWARMFLEEQGYILDGNHFYQDNESAIKLELNGRASCGQKSRHIDIRFFFIKDRLKTEHITLTHCDTEAMLADFFTKPLQGGLFIKFKDIIMGHKHINDLKSSTSSHIEERVEKNEIIDEKGVFYDNNKTMCEHVRECEENRASEENRTKDDLSTSRSSVLTVLKSTKTTINGQSASTKSCASTDASASDSTWKLVSYSKKKDQNKSVDTVLNVPVEQNATSKKQMRSLVAFYKNNPSSKC